MSDGRPRPRLDLTDEGIQQMVRDLAPLLDSRVGHLIDPQLCIEHEAIVTLIGKLDWSQINTAVEHAVSILVDATYPGGVIDPDDPHGDVPWTLVLLRMRDTPRLGSRSARQWFRRLRDYWCDGHAVSSSVASVACYSIAVYEDRLDRRDEVIGWWDMAARMTPYGASNDVGVVVGLVRAARLLRPLLRTQVLPMAP